MNHSRPGLPSSLLLVAAVLGGCILARGGTAGETSAATLKPAVITLHEFVVRIQALQKQEADLWTEFDLDRDRKVSEVEVLAALARRQTWFSDRFPDLFRAVDGNHNRKLSAGELDALAKRSGGPVTLAVTERTKSVRERSNLDGAADLKAGAGNAFTFGDGDRVRASATFATQYSYIKGYDVVGGNFDPVIGVLSSGQTINVGDFAIIIERLP